MLELKITQWTGDTKLFKLFRPLFQSSSLHVIFFMAKSSAENHCVRSTSTGYIKETIYDTRYRITCICSYISAVIMRAPDKRTRMTLETEVGKAPEPHLLTGVQHHDDKPLRIACDGPGYGWLSHDDCTSPLSNVHQNGATAPFYNKKTTEK